MSSRVLDLFCGAGGAAIGYAKAGFEVVGVDIEPQPNYPYMFVRADALMSPFDLGEFDLIHASPPCQGYSRSLKHTSKDVPKLIEDIRQIISEYPHVIENVVGAPLDGIQLCGTSFGLRMWRHRLFETSFPIMAPPCQHPNKIMINPYKTKSRHKLRKETGEPVMHTYKRELGFEFMTDNEALEAIPSEYTEYIGRAFLGDE